MTNTTDDIESVPTGPVSHSLTAPRPAHAPGGRRGRLLAAVAGTMLLAGSAVVVGRVAADTTPSDPCAATAGGSADSLERRALACRADMLVEAVECLRSTSGTPNAVERWTAYCLAQLTEDN